MKKIATSQDTQRMARLRQFMLRQGIAVTVSEQGGTLEMWVVDPRHYDIAVALLDQFTDDPADTSATQTGSIFGPTLRNLGQQAGVVTLVIAVVILIVAALQFFWSMSDMLSALMITPPGSNELSMSQPWRLITPALLHLSAAHLFFNLFWWWYLGGRIELVLGGKTLLLLFVVTGVSANLLQWYTSGPLFGGLSGVVYGLFGFCAVYGWRRRSALNLPPALLAFMVGWLLLGYTEILWINMANDAHLMGLISGLILGLLYRVNNRGTGQRTT